MKNEGLKIASDILAAAIDIENAKKAYLAYADAQAVLSAWERAMATGLKPEDYAELLGGIILYETEGVLHPALVHHRTLSINGLNFDYTASYVAPGWMQHPRIPIDDLLWWGKVSIKTAPVFSRSTFSAQRPAPLAKKIRMFVVFEALKFYEKRNSLAEIEG